MSSVRRALVACLVLTALAVGAGASPAVAADLTIDQARSYMFDKINSTRADNGLAGVQLDTRAQSVAQARSDDMATHHYFGHLSNSNLAAMFNARDIKWSKIGEILAENDYPTLDDSANVAMDGWRNSSTHWSIIEDGAYSHAGVGLAKDTSSGDWIWTVEFVKEPSLTATPPTAWFASKQVMPFTSTSSNVKVTWAGSPGSADLQDYRLEYRINNGSWRTLFTATTRTAYTIHVAHGKKVQFRVRARDASRTVGAWALSESLAA